MRIPRKKNPVYIPTNDASTIELQFRDKRIFSYIAHYDRLLADYQILQLLHREAEQLRGQERIEEAEELESTPEALDVRLGKLANAGYIHKLDKWKRSAFDYGIYWLTKRGAQEHAEDNWQEFVFPNNPDFRQTVHDVAIVDFRLHVENNCRQEPRFELIEWINQGIFKDDPDRVAFTKRNGKDNFRNIIPDGFYLIHDKHETDASKGYKRLLFEMDMGTKDRNKMIDEKILPGIAYIKTKAYSQRFGSNRGWWTYVCADMNTLFLLKRKVELHVPKQYLNGFWFTHPDYVTDNVLLDRIWWRSGRPDDQQYSLLND